MLSATVPGSRRPLPMMFASTGERAGGRSPAKGSPEVRSVSVIGLGYIGLPTAVILAARGMRVFGVDVNPATVDAVNAGELPFVEPDLCAALEEVVGGGMLSAHLEPVPAEAHILAVPTPFNGDRTADLSFIFTALQSLAPALSGGELIVLESTSPPGTTELVAERLGDLRPDLAGRIDIAHCPERVLPGRVMIELIENNRVVGGATPDAAQRAAQLYRRFCRGEILLTDARTAEFTKLVENSYRDVNIAFANELSMICSDVGVDVWRVIELANHHPRVNILSPGPGVGGHCIAVDPWFIVQAAPERARLIRTAREVNDEKPQFVVDQIREAVLRTGATTVAALGLAFKKNIDDLRESPALEVVARLCRAEPSLSILAVEPHIRRLPDSLSHAPSVRLATLEEALAGSEVVALLVDHDEFLGVDAAALGNRTVIDTRGALRPASGG